MQVATLIAAIDRALKAKKNIVVWYRTAVNDSLSLFSFEDLLKFDESFLMSEIVGKRQFTSNSEIITSYYLIDKFGCIDDNQSIFIIVGDLGEIIR